jgi:hypothetical protein
MHLSRTIVRVLAVAALIAAPMVSRATTPAGDTFTYQGELKTSGQLASGSYDFEVKLFDSLFGGIQIGPTLTKLNTPVVQGRFTVKLNFGNAAFNGEQRFLSIAVRPAGSGSYTALDRQELTPAPYALSLALPMSASGDSDSGFIPGGLFQITQAGSAAAILGTNTGTGAGLQGYATGDGTGVLASAPNGTALRINGAIRVTGAGVNTWTPAFIHLATPTNAIGHSTFISNAMCNGDPDAILIVTYNVNGTGFSSNSPLGVSYDPSSGFWWIMNQNGAAMTPGAKYNVLVIKN